MAGIQGVNITSQGDNALAGAVTYADLAALKASQLPATGSSKLAFVQSRHAWFSWDATSALTANDLDVVVSTANGASDGRWIRLFFTHRVHQLVSNWYIDPVSGSDDSNGTTSGTALKTDAELNLRLAGKLSISTTVNVLADITTLSLTVFTSLDYVANASSSSIILTVTGQRTLVRSGTISAKTDAVPATPIYGAITDASATWATSISSKYLGVLTSGASNTRVFWVCKDNGASSGRINTPINDTNGAAASFPAVNDTYGEYTLTTGVINIKTDCVVNIKNWTNVGSGFIVATQGIAVYSSIVSNVQSLYSVAGVNLLACRDGSSTALQPIVPTRMQVAGCTFMQSPITTRNNTVVSFTTSFLQGVKIFAGGTTTIPGGFVSIQSTGIADVSGIAIDLNRGSVCRIGTTTWGNGNTTGISVLTGSKVIVDSGITPTLTGTTEINIDGVANLLPALEASGGAVLPAVSACTTWAQWAAAPFTRNAICTKSGAGIVSA